MSPRVEIHPQPDGRFSVAAEMAWPQLHGQWGLGSLGVYETRDEALLARSRVLYPEKEDA